MLSSSKNFQLTLNTCPNAWIIRFTLCPISKGTAKSLRYQILLKTKNNNTNNTNA